MAAFEGRSQPVDSRCTGANPTVTSIRVPGAKVSMPRCAGSGGLGIKNGDVMSHRKIDSYRPRAVKRSKWPTGLRL
jgi:hypothetical protein